MYEKPFYDVMTTRQREWELGTDDDDHHHNDDDDVTWKTLFDV